MKKNILKWSKYCSYQLSSCWLTTVTLRVKQKFLDSLQLSFPSPDFHQDTMRVCEV